MLYSDARSPALSGCRYPWRSGWPRADPGTETPPIRGAAKKEPDIKSGTHSRSNGRNALHGMRQGRGNGAGGTFRRDESPCSHPSASVRRSPSVRRTGAIWAGSRGRPLFRPNLRPRRPVRPSAPLRREEPLCRRHDPAHPTEGRRPTTGPATGRSRYV